MRFIPPDSFLHKGIILGGTFNFQLGFHYYVGEDWHVEMLPQHYLLSVELKEGGLDFSTYPFSMILRFDEQGIERVNYQETEHYQVTRRFLNDHPRYVNYLLGDFPLE